MIKPIDINAELARRPMLHGRTPQSSAAETGAAFATLAAYRNGAIFAGRFSGESAWERHPNGDEIVYILDGATTLTIIASGNDQQTLELSGGMMLVVPQGAWHRFQAPDGVTVMTVTPQPTDHSMTSVPPRSAEPV